MISNLGSFRRLTTIPTSHSSCRIRGEVAEIKADISGFRERLGHIWGQVAGICEMCAILSSRMDRMDRRLERRLDLVKA
jgi:hypothetical protein